MNVDGLAEMQRLALKMWEAHEPRNVGGLQMMKKGKVMDSPPERPEGAQPCRHCEVSC